MQPDYWTTINDVLYKGYSIEEVLNQVPTDYTKEFTIYTGSCTKYNIDRGELAYYRYNLRFIELGSKGYTGWYKVRLTR